MSVTHPAPVVPSAASASTAIAGITMCTNCRARFRVQQKHVALVGKSMRCPKCHNQFVLQLEVPTAVEEAAISNAEQQETCCESEQPPRPKRKVRTRSQIKKQTLSAIKRGMRPFHSRLSQLAAQDRCSEEQVRVWVIDVLRTVLGYKDTEIDTESYALNQRIDIALKRDDKVFMVIECKNTRSRLAPTAVNQAVMYAANKSADWAVVTSGQVWRLYRVFPVRGSDPQIVEVFDLSLLDIDGVSEDDIAHLYLLTSKAIFSGETERVHHRVAALSNRNLLAALTSDRVIKALRRSLIESYAKSSKTRVKLLDSDVEERVCDTFLPRDLSDPPRN